MSLDEVIIGTGPLFGSAIHVFAIDGDHGIAENRTAFWICGSRRELDIDMKVFRDTPEGEQLSALIQAKAGLEAINSALDAMLLRHIRPEVMMRLIRDMRNKAYREGQENKAAEIRGVLGIFEPMGRLDGIGFGDDH